MFSVWFSNFWNRVRRIRFVLSLTMAFLMLLKGITVLFYFHKQYEAELEMISNYQVTKLQQNIVSQLNLFLHGVSNSIQSASFSTKNFDNEQDLRTKTLSFMKVIPQIKKLTFALEEGEYAIINRLSKNRLNNQIFSLMLFSKDKNLPVKKEYLNEWGDVIASELKMLGEDHGSMKNVSLGWNDLEDQRDPFGRDWYNASRTTRKEFWSKISVSRNDERLWLTVSNPILNSGGKFMGAVAAEVGLEPLNSKLKNHISGPIKSVFLIKDSGEIIAHPWIHRLAWKTHLPRIDDVKEYGINRYFHRYLESRGDGFFRSDQGKEVVYFSAIKHPTLKDWHVCIVAKINALVENLEMKQRTMFWFAVVSTILSYFLGMLIAKKISSAVEEVAQELNEIKDFSFELTPLKHTSYFTEIKEMLSLLDSVKIALGSFRKFVPTTLVQKLVQEGKSAECEGTKENLTVMFSDIKGFSSVVERIKDSTILFNHMYEYFEEMTKIIKEYNGTIDKYIGDGIMAFWGAPTKLEQHAYLTCAAALKCNERLEKLNPIWEAKGFSAMSTRFGINTGEMLVGNMGSSDRLQYTLLGDNVNIAARLEPLNKVYGTSILISESTYNLVKGKIIARIVDKVMVYGKTEVITVYEPLTSYFENKTNVVSEKVPNAIKKMMDTNKAFDHYLAGNFKDAKLAYKKLLEVDPKDPLAKYFIKQCEDLIENPEKWEGFSKQTK